MASVSQQATVRQIKLRRCCSRNILRTTAPRLAFVGSVFPSCQTGSVPTAQTHSRARIVMLVFLSSSTSRPEIAFSQPVPSRDVRYAEAPIRKMAASEPSTAPSHRTRQKRTSRRHRYNRAKGKRTPGPSIQASLKRAPLGPSSLIKAPISCEQKAGRGT